MSFLLLVVSVLGLGVAISFCVPSDLVARAERPYAGYGTSAVRLESPVYPRYATGADDERVRVDAPPQRIVSQDSHADEFLYAVAPPERIVGVSETAYEGRLSNVLEHVNRHRPIVATDAERVLLADPDLVFTPASARGDMPSLLRRAGVPVYRIFTMFETLDSIEAHIRLIGYLTGEDARATAEVQRFRGVVDAAVRRRPAGSLRPRVLGLGGTYTYGSRTLFGDIVRWLGAENVAATHGLVGYDRVTDEHIVRWNPDWIVAGAPRGDTDRVRASLLNQPAIAATRAAELGQIVVLEYQVFLPLSPMTAHLVTALADALYGPARGSA